MTLLIETSSKTLSIGLYNDNNLLFVSNVNSYSKHSNYLLNEIVNVLSKYNININDIENYVFLNGPGSFTGLRVGATVCKTLAWTLSKKVYQISNLLSLKQGVDDEIVITIIYDKEKISYVGIYTDNEYNEYYLDIENEKLSFENKNISIVSLEDNPFVENLFNRLNQKNNVKKIIQESYNFKEIIKYALSKDSVNVHTVKPIYLKKIDAEKNK